MAIFRGRPLITHGSLSDDLAYSICQAIDLRQKVIPIDDEAQALLDMKKICRSTEAAPLDILLDPGAKKYYRGKGCF